MQVRGDAGHPVSQGYTCAKGRGLADWHHGPTRLDRPRRAGTETGWSVVLDDLAAQLGNLIGSHGPDAVALYLATGMAYDAAGQVASALWLGSLPSRSFFTAATVDNAPVLVAAELVAGNAMLSPVWDATAHGLLLLVGTNPVVSHGYGTTIPDPVRHLRAHRARRWSPVGHRPSPQRDGGAGRRAPGGAPRRRRRGAGGRRRRRPGRRVRPGRGRSLLRPGGRGRPAPSPSPPSPSSGRRGPPGSTPKPSGASSPTYGPTGGGSRSCAARARPWRATASSSSGCAGCCSSSPARSTARAACASRTARWAGSAHRAPTAPPWCRGRAAASGPASRTDLTRVAGQVPAVALADEIEAGLRAGPRDHRRQPHQRHPRARPDAGGPVLARRARRGGRGRERAHRPRHPRAARHRPTRACRPHAGRQPLGALRSAGHRGGGGSRGGAAPGVVDVRVAGGPDGRRPPRGR